MTRRSRVRVPPRCPPAVGVAPLLEGVALAVGAVALGAVALVGVLGLPLLNHHPHPLRSPRRRRLHHHLLLLPPSLLILLILLLLLRLPLLSPLRRPPLRRPWVLARPMPRPLCQILLTRGPPSLLPLLFLPAFLSPICLLALVPPLPLLVLPMPLLMMMISPPPTSSSVAPLLSRRGVMMVKADRLSSVWKF